MKRRIQAQRDAFLAASNHQPQPIRTRRRRQTASIFMPRWRWVWALDSTRPSTTRLNVCSKAHRTQRRGVCERYNAAFLGRENPARINYTKRRFHKWKWVIERPVGVKSQRGGPGDGSQSKSQPPTKPPSASQNAGSGGWESIQKPTLPKGIHPSIYRTNAGSGQQGSAKLMVMLLGSDNPVSTPPRSRLSGVLLLVHSPRAQVAAAAAATATATACRGREYRR